MITVLEFELVNNKTCKYTQNPTDSKVAYSLPARTTLMKRVQKLYKTGSDIKSCHTDP